MRRILGLILVVLLVGVILAQDEEEEIDDPLMMVVADVPGVQGVVDAEIAEVDEQTVVTVIYLTREISEIGYRAEILDVFRAVGDYLDTEEIEADFVAVVPEVVEDAPLETITTGITNLQDLLTGDITRSRFLDELDIVPGEHQIQPPEDPEGQV